MCIRRQESLWRSLKFTCIVDLLSNDGMRTDHHTFPALNAYIGVPLRHLQCNIAFLATSCARKVGTVGWQNADRQSIPVASNHWSKHITYELWSFCWYRWSHR